MPPLLVKHTSLYSSTSRHNVAGPCPHTNAHLADIETSEDYKPCIVHYHNVYLSHTLGRPAMWIYQAALHRSRDDRIPLAIPSTDIGHAADVMDEEVFILESAKGAVLRQLHLATVPSPGSAAFADLHRTRLKIEAVLLAKRQCRSKKCQSCGRPMTTTKLAWKGATPFGHAMRWFTNVSPDRILPGGDYSMSNVRLVCLACQLLRDDVPVAQWQAALGRLSVEPMPEVHGGFLASYNNGLDTYDDEWKQSDRQVAAVLHHSLESIASGGRQRLTRWHQEHQEQQQQQGQQREGQQQRQQRQRPMPKVIASHLAREEITTELLKVTVTAHSFRDVTGIVWPVELASVDRIDPRGDHTLANSRIVYRGVNLFRTNCPDDRFLVEALKRWKKRSSHGLSACNAASLNSRGGQQWTSAQQRARGSHHPRTTHSPP